MANASITINCSNNKIFVVSTAWTANQTVSLILKTSGGSVLQTVTGTSSGGAYVGEISVADGSYRLVVNGSIDGDITLPSPYNGVFPVACGINAVVTINCSTNKVEVSSSGWPGSETVTIKLLAPSNTELQQVSGLASNGRYSGAFTVSNGSYKVSVTGSVSGSATVQSPYSGIFEVNCATACNLVINSTTVVNDTNSQSTGSITVGAASSYAIQYSLNGTTWQSSNVLSGLAAGPYKVYTKDANLCTKEKSNIVVGNNACNITITSLLKTDETASNLNDGTVTVSATSTPGGIMYSLDGGTYQSSGVFTKIPPGVHSIFVRDAAICFVSRNFTIEEFPDATIPDSCFPLDLFEISPSIPYRFKSLPCNPQPELNPDDELFNEIEICGINKTCFYQSLGCLDTLTIQIQFKDIEYKTKPSLSIFNYADDSLLAVVDFINVTGDYWQIEKNIFEINNICEKVVYLVIKSYYDITLPKQYLFTYAKSEPIYISNHDCSLVLEYWNNSNYNGVNYEDVSYINKLRVEGEFYHTEYPQEKDVYVKSNGERVKLRETIKKIKQLRIGYAPQYIHEKLALALSHDHIRINGVYYVSEENYSNKAVKNYALETGEVTLTEKYYQNKNLIK